YKAAQIFIGYYLVNTRARVEYCQERNVDLTRFAEEFGRLHREPYERAVAELKAKGLSVDKVWSVTKGAMSRAITIDMVGAGIQYAGMPNACEEVAKRAKYFARKLELRERQPDVYQALMGS